MSPTGIKVEGREDASSLTFTSRTQRAPSGLLEGRYLTALDPALSGGGEDLYVDLAEAEESVARYCWSPYMHDPGLRDRLRRIHVPTTIIFGAGDRFVINPPLL